MLGESFMTDLALIRPFASVSPEMNNQVLPDTKALPADLTNIRFFSSVYPHMNLKIRLTGDSFPTDLTTDPIFPGVFFNVALERGLPEGLVVAEIALELLPLRVALGMETQVGGTGVGGVANPADERPLASVGENVSLERLLGVEPSLAVLAVRVVLLVVLHHVEPQVIRRHLGHSADLAAVPLVVLLQMDPQELVGLEGFIADVAGKRSLLLMHLHHVSREFLVVVENSIALPAFFSFGLSVVQPVVSLPLVEIPGLFSADFTLVPFSTFGFFFFLFRLGFQLLRVGFQLHWLWL